jgi:CubicO group peptidase (beta-lactamase class C family)
MNLGSIIETARERVHEIKERYGVPGVAVALIDGEAAVWTECCGAVDGEGTRPIDPRTIFSLQSTSKTFTATAVMLAVQQGLLDLGAPVTTYLPDFSVRSRFEWDPQAKMTLRHLLSHRAGFTHEAPLGGNFDPELETAAPNFEAHVASISDTWLRYPVGQRYAYSNLGIDLAGAILMKACRASFAECLDRLIFEPLRMTDSTADAAVYAARANRAVGHQPGFKAVPVRIPIEASGGVYSSVADMARFASFQLGRGRLDTRTHLDPELWTEMHTPRFEGVPYALGILRTPLRLERGSPVLFNHDGRGYGFSSCFTYCPERQLAWVALSNQLGPPGATAPFDQVALHPALEAEFGPRTHSPQPTGLRATPSREALAPYVGTYLAGQAIMALGWEGDTFGFRLPDDEALNPLVFTGPDRGFVASGPRAPCRFRLYPDNRSQPAWVQFEVDDDASRSAFGYGATFDMNEPRDQSATATGEAYDRFLGDYSVTQWGTPVMTVSLRQDKGDLCLGPIRLIEHAPGLLFSADGEALDLTGDTPTFRNIPLHRIKASERG